MKIQIICISLTALLLTGCSSQKNSNALQAEPSPAASSTLTAASTTIVTTTTKPEYPTRTLDCVENVTITVPEIPDCPINQLLFFDCKREIEGREPAEYLQSYFNAAVFDDADEKGVITELPNQNGIRIWKYTPQHPDQHTYYAAEKHHLYYFMESTKQNPLIENMLEEMQIDDSKLHYAYDPDNDYSDDTPYCYSLLLPVGRKLYDEIYQTLNPLTIPEHRTWTRSNVTEEQAEHLHRILDEINIDYDEEFYFHNREITYKNGVFTVHSEMMVDSVPPEQLIPENQKAYQNICENADRFIEAMPKTLTRYGKYIYLAKAVCDMTEYVNYLEGGQEPNYYWGRIRGAFEDGKTFCQGYGDAYEFLCHRAGLYCLCINGNGHKWSGIRLNNVLYHMDTTWMDAGEGDYYKAYSHPFTSDEEGHEPHMKDFHVWSHLYPEWGDMVLNTGSIDWEKELTAPAI